MDFSLLNGEIELTNYLRGHPFSKNASFPKNKHFVPPDTHTYALDGWALTQCVKKF